MNNNTIVEDNESPPDIELSEETFGKNYGYGIGFSLGFLILFSIMAYASYLCIRSRSRNNSNVPNNSSSSSHDDGSSTTIVDNELVYVQRGIDEEILRNYPKLLYSQVKVHCHDKEDNNIVCGGCSICLVDYKDNDMLRLLSNCGHIFHVKCIDPWLRLHPTCPICRNSQLPSTPFALR